MDSKRAVILGLATIGTACASYALYCYYKKSTQCDQADKKAEIDMTDVAKTNPSSCEPPAEAVADTNGHVGHDDGEEKTPANEFD